MPWRRLLQSLAVLALMSVIVHGMIALMPGDPIDLMIAADPHLSSADAARLKALHGLDRPWVERYAAWAGQALTGDLGYSRLFAKPVLEVMGPALVSSLALMGCSLVLALALALPMGIAAAARPGGWTDRCVNLICFVGVSAPSFWLGLMLMAVFAVGLGWLPAGGTESLGPDGGGLWDKTRHMILPACALAFASLGQYARHTRAAMLEQGGQDYIRTARAKGCGPVRVLLRHQWRCALLPLAALLGLEFGNLFSGALITETIFSRPGMGKLIADAVMGNDYNLALTALLAATAMTLAGNLAADIAAARIDPRSGRTL